LHSKLHLVRALVGHTSDCGGRGPLAPVTITRRINYDAVVVCWWCSCNSWRRRGWDNIQPHRQLDDDSMSTLRRVGRPHWQIHVSLSSQLSTRSRRRQLHRYHTTFTLSRRPFRRLTVTFPVAGHRCPAAGTKLYCYSCAYMCVYPVHIAWRNSAFQLRHVGAWVGDSLRESGHSAIIDAL